MTINKILKDFDDDLINQSSMKSTMVKKNTVSKKVAQMDVLNQFGIYDFYDCLGIEEIIVTYRLPDSIISSESTDLTSELLNYYLCMILFGKKPKINTRLKKGIKTFEESFSHRVNIKSKIKILEFLNYLHLNINPAKKKKDSKVSTRRYSATLESLTIEVSADNFFDLFSLSHELANSFDPSAIVFTIHFKLSVNFSSSKGFQRFFAYDNYEKASIEEAWTVEYDINTVMFGMYPFWIFRNFHPMKQIVPKAIKKLAVKGEKKIKKKKSK
jgi:hypothetical protein